jgi:hypothetical protein
MLIRILPNSEHWCWGSEIDTLVQLLDLANLFSIIICLWVVIVCRRREFHDIGGRYSIQTRRLHYSPSPDERLVSVFISFVSLQAVSESWQCKWIQFLLDEAQLKAIQFENDPSWFTKSQ